MPRPVTFIVQIILLEIVSVKIVVLQVIDLFFFNIFFKTSNISGFMFILDLPFVRYEN